MPQPEVLALRLQRYDAEIAALWVRYDALILAQHRDGAPRPDAIARAALREEIRHAYLTRYVGAL